MFNAPCASAKARRGSYIITTKAGHIATLSVPNHPEVARGTLRSLIAKAGLSVGESSWMLLESNWVGA